MCCLPLLAALLCVGPALLAAQTPPVHVDVFVSGTEGYHTFRIPALVTAPDGTLIAFAEGRKENTRDPGGGDIDLVYKRSFDRGGTWTPLQVLDDPGQGWAASNPTPVTDRHTRRVWILYNRWEPGHGTESSQPGTRNNQTWARYSRDNGATWSEPLDLTSAARDFDHWGAIFVGPGGAIQTRTGRLVVPAAMKPDTLDLWISVGGFEGPIRLLRAYVLYSDDHGQSWKRGALVKAQTDENQVVELEDGALLMDARQGTGTHRWRFISQDGGQTWSRPGVGQTVTPVATAIERWTLRESGGRNRILWVGPAGPGRLRLVARLSYDEGFTFPVEKVLYDGIAAYADIAILQDGTAGVLWERGVSRHSQFISFTRLKLESLE